MPLPTHDQLQTAIEAADFDNLEAMIGALLEADRANAKVLALALFNCSLASCLRYWRHSFEDGGAKLAGSIRSACTLILLRGGFTPGQDFSADQADGLKILLVSPEAWDHLIQELPGPRLASLRLAIRRR